MRAGVRQVGRAPIGRPEGAAAGHVRPRRLDAFFRVLDVPDVSEQDRLEARPDRPLGQPLPRFLIQLDHCREVVELRRAAEIVERMQVVRRVFARELDVVEDAGQADDLDERWPRVVEMRPERGTAGAQRLAERVRSHRWVLSRYVPVAAESSGSWMAPPDRTDRSAASSISVVARPDRPSTAGRRSVPMDARKSPSWSA